jgi:hypothetical protein
MGTGRIFNGWVPNSRWAAKRRDEYIAKQQAALSMDNVPAHLRGSVDEAQKVSDALFDRSKLPMKPPGKS